MSHEPIHDGAVAVQGDRIVGVAPFTEMRDSFQRDLVDLGEQIVLPGLINAHCHLDYTMLRGKISPQQTFTDWIRAINSLKATLKDEDYLTAIAAGLAEAQSFGTTSMVNLEAFPRLLPHLPTLPLRVWWCAEMIDLRERVPVDLLSHDLRAWYQSRPTMLGGVGLAPHALYTASAQLFAETDLLARRHELLLTTHLAESHEEMQMFRNASGPLFEFLQSIGRPMNDCGHETPIARLIDSQKIDSRWIVAHLNEITEADFDLLATRDKFHVVHCPSSHAFFGHRPFRLQRLQEQGFNICLGTDSLASNSSLNLFSEMRELLRQNHSLSPREVLTMATINGARAVGQERSLGQINPGHRADLIAIPWQPGRDLYETIISFEGKTEWMMVNGQDLSTT